MSYIADTLNNLIHQTAFFNITGGNVIMIIVACVFLYLAIAKQYEPLLLTPIAFGMLLVNIYPDIMAPIGADGTAGNSSVPDLYGGGGDDGFRTADRQS